MLHLTSDLNGTVLERFTSYLEELSKISVRSNGYDLWNSSGVSSWSPFARPIYATCLPATACAIDINMTMTMQKEKSSICCLFQS